MKIALDKAVLTELPLRDSQFTWQSRDYVGNRNIKININTSYIFVGKAQGSNQFLVAVKSPLWNRGWKKISKDAQIANEIDYMFFFITQYIQRSLHINVIGAIAFALNETLDFRYSSQVIETEASYFRYNGFDKNPKFPNLTTEEQKINQAIRGYLSIINSLDPSVNRAMFYFLRSMELSDKDFLEESLTALDNTVHVILQFFKIHNWEREKAFQKVLKIFKIGDSDVFENLKKLYELRCGFTAHPAQAKWWDFGEIYFDTIEDIRFSVRKLLISFLKFENLNRTVEAEPEFWSQWFCKNAERIYDITWFHKLPV